MSEQLTYTDHDGANQTIEGLTTYRDKAGRYWLWSDKLQQNLAYKERSREDMLLSALNSALFRLDLAQTERNQLRKLEAKVRELFDDDAETGEGY